MSALVGGCYILVKDLFDQHFYSQLVMLLTSRGPQAMQTGARWWEKAALR